jgi:uncharacterized protein YciI
MKNTFAICYRRGPAWFAGKTVFEQPLGEHLQYMRTLSAAKTLVFGGPFSDDSGGLVIVDVTDAQQAHDIVRNDPAVRDGVMVAEAHPWKLMAGAW